MNRMQAFHKKVKLRNSKQHWLNVRAWLIERTEQVDKAWMNEPYMPWEN